MDKGKIIIVMVCLIFLGIPSYCLTLEGGVVYTVETARQEAFEGVEYQIPVSEFSAYLKDPNYLENKKALADGRVDLGDRWIERYSDNSYGIVFKVDRYKTYTYNSKGKLIGYGIRSSLDCPLKRYRYTSKGKLKGISFIVSLNEAFLYDINGNLEAHWIGNKCYDERGRFILKRY